MATTTTAAPASIPDKPTEGDADIVTQLQSRLDELATQLYAALRYTSTHHPSTASSALAGTVVNPPPQSDAPHPSQPTQTSAASFQQTPGSPSHNPQPSGTFEADLQELAMDLVSKQVEIEGLIKELPADLDEAQRRQEKRIAELAGRLEAMEGRAAKVEERRERALGRVEGVIGRFGRG